MDGTAGRRGTVVGLGADGGCFEAVTLCVGRLLLAGGRETLYGVHLLPSGDFDHFFCSRS